MDLAKRILVVEDAESTKRSITRSLKEAGHDVIPADNEKLVFEIISQELDLIALIIMDMDLSGSETGGIETLQMIKKMEQEKEISPGVPVILISAKDATEMERELKRYEMQDAYQALLTKPLNEESLDFLLKSTKDLLNQDSDDETEWSKTTGVESAFHKFLLEEKNYPQGCLRNNISLSVTGDRSEIVDLVAVDKEDENLLWLAEFGDHEDTKEFGKPDTRISRVKQTMLHNHVRGYIICPPREKSSYSFEIYDVPAEGDGWLIEPDKFPRYEGLAKDVKSGEKEGEKAVALDTRIAFMNNDRLRDADGKILDRLGIENEVNAISAVVAAKDAEPPISIGLFGDWGSGKSFFMDMMYDRINLIQEESRDWVAKNKTSYFCTDVVQIKFNAWHYMDANLWASLVTHIFDELAKEINKKGEDELDETKKLLFKKVESTKVQLEEAGEKEKDAKKLKLKAQKALKALTKQKETAHQELNHIRLGDVITLAKEDPRVKAQFSEISDRLGLKLDDPTAEQLRMVVQQSRTLWGQIDRVIKNINSRKRGKLKLIGMTLFLVFLPVIIWILVTWAVPPGWWQKLTGLIGAAVALQRAFVKTILPQLKRISAGIDLWEKTQEKIQMIGAEKSREEMELLERVRMLEDKESEAAKEAMEAEKRFQKASEELKEISTGRRLYKFIEERSRRTEYKEQLGIIALIRDDFEKLSELISKSSSEKPKNKKTPKAASENQDDEKTRIDRIVLYIDDLDRCPSERVVQVLQAVHLLLAFKLFVVVVGVDSRWILHALREEYSAFGAHNQAKDLRRRWLTTPQNYIEKIFQIPFALRPMEDKGYMALVGSLTHSDLKIDSITYNEDLAETKNTKKIDEKHDQKKKEKPPPDKKEEQKKKGLIIADIGKKKDEKAETEEQKDQEKVTINMQPDSLDIKEKEIKFTKKLGNLVPSPRATKRLINVYRLIRATIEDSKELSRFEGPGDEAGDYQAVLLMLAILTGYPSQAGDILKAFTSGSLKVNGLSEFIMKLKTRKIPKSDPPIYQNIASKNISKSDRASWDKLSDTLENNCRELDITDSLDPFLHWADWVARFNFQYDQTIL
jgi:CheY-like chemotaxis protein